MPATEVLSATYIFRLLTNVREVILFTNVRDWCNSPEFSGRRHSGRRLKSLGGLGEGEHRSLSP